MRIVALSTGALAVLAVAGGLAVLNGNDERAEEDPTAATLAGRRGMVEGTVWIANEGGGSLTAIDAATNRIVTTVAGVEGPHNVQVSPDGASVWTVSGHDGYAAMLSAESLDLHGVVPTGCEAARPEDTDWPQILALYDHLHALAPGPMESLSRIVALAQVHGPVQAEAELEAFADDPALGGQYRVDAVRGHLKELAGDRVAARTYYLHAARHSLSVPEQRHLLGRADRLN